MEQICKSQINNLKKLYQILIKISFLKKVKREIQLNKSYLYNLTKLYNNMITMIKSIMIKKVV